MPAPRKYPQELRDRALRLVSEARSQDEGLSLNAAVHWIGQREHLAYHVEADPKALVFTEPRGGPLRRKAFSADHWKPALERARIEDLRMHDLRHTCASLLIATGANPKAVQAHLGHSSIQVTFDRYGHLFPSDQEALADRMDEVYLGSLTDTRRTLDGQRVVELA